MYSANVHTYIFCVRTYQPERGCPANCPVQNNEQTKRLKQVEEAKTVCQKPTPVENRHDSIYVFVHQVCLKNVCCSSG